MAEFRRLRSPALPAHEGNAEKEGSGDCRGDPGRLCSRYHETGQRYENGERVDRHPANHQGGRGSRFGAGFGGPLRLPFSVARAATAVSAAAGALGCGFYRTRLGADRLRHRVGGGAIADGLSRRPFRLAQAADRGAVPRRLGARLGRRRRPLCLALGRGRSSGHRQRRLPPGRLYDPVGEDHASRVSAAPFRSTPFPACSATRWRR